MKLLTVKQVMKALGVKRQSTIYRYIHSGRLNAHRLGDGSKGHWRISQEDLNKFLKEGDN